VYTDVGWIFNVFIYLLGSAYAHQGCIFDQFSILMHFKCNVNAEFSASLLQSSVLHGPSEFSMSLLSL